MRALIAVVAAMFLPAVAPAQESARSDTEILAQAEAAFRRGVESKGRFLVARQHFSEAADRYLELHRRGLHSAALYRSLGNAAFLADRWPEAIWAYQVGLKLDPNDAAMREHLEFARAKVLYPPSGEGRLDADTWPVWLHRPTLFELFCVFVACYNLAILAAVIFNLARHSGEGRLAKAAVASAAALLLIAVAAGAALWHASSNAERDRRTPIVVIADNTPLYQGNADSYPRHPTIPILPRGMEARQIHVRGNWLQIRLSTGEVGWLPRKSVLVVQ